MRFFTLIITLAVASLALSLAAGPALAQQSANNSTAGTVLPGGLNDCAEPEPVDNHTVICSASLQGGDAVLVLRSDKLQRITLTDGGAVFQGGEITERRRTIRANEQNTVRIPVTQTRGYAGVVIRTGSGTLYGKPIRSESSLFTSPFTREDVTTASLSAALSVAFVTIVIVIRAVTGRADEPERLA